MKIAVIGGGPAGLYFAILMKKQRSTADIVVYERNRADDTFGFGVVFSDATLDNFEMALAAAGSAEGASPEALKSGIAMVQQQLKSTLAEAGLEEVDASGQVFDPNLHEAVAQEESADVPEGRVLRQLRKGYRLRERLLRPATVIVARKPAA